MAMKVILCGPPHSGKSCLREGLKQAIRRLPDAPYPYVITGCPDGEGAWFQEAALNDPELARQLKEDYKSKFTPEFARRIAESVANVALPLTLIDVGGRISPENRQIMAPTTHAIILAGNWEDESYEVRMDPWRAFCAELGLTVVAEVFSDYFGTEDKVIGNDDDGVIRGSVHHLERGEDNSQRPMVVALAQHLVNLATSS
jgi:CRISPR-associated protein Csx3